MTERDSMIVALALIGFSKSAVARHVGLSPERVRQIVRRGRRAEIQRLLEAVTAARAALEAFYR